MAIDSRQFVRCIAIGLWFFAAASAAAPGDAIYSRPGQIVPAGDGARLNMYCLGTGSPTVVMDSGWGDWAPAWAVVQPRIAQFTRVCSYDRAGAGFSDPGPLPRTSERIAGELHDALRAASIAGPYVLVGHAFGGDHIRAFADLYMQDVAGVVLVDADASDIEPAAMRRKDDSGILAYIPDLKACRDAIAEGKPLPAVSSGPGGPPTNCAQQTFFRGLPEAEWSPELNAKLLEIAQSKLAMWDADISEMQNMPADELWLQRHRTSFGARPIRVLTSGNHAVGHLETQRPVSLEHLKYEYDIALTQSRWLTLSSNAKQVFTGHSSEYIQFDQPEVVVGAVQEVCAQSK
ncbi:MAG TPA: alpha/beta hydrolase [Gammaproteobacteria bacterium]|nr:alpha/beta hydrolase [Gammaproteobacteria bacterium]